MMSPFVIRHYCVRIGRTIVFYGQTVNYNWFLGHLDLICLRHLTAPILLVGIFQKLVASKKTGYVSSDGPLPFAEGILRVS